MSSLVNSILDAAYIFGYRKKKHSEGHINPKMQENSREAFAFVSGTGLETMIEYYQIDYNAEEIREKFYQLFKINT